jgi:hypothetical protein
MEGGFDDCLMVGSTCSSWLCFGVGDVQQCQWWPASFAVLAWQGSSLDLKGGAMHMRGGAMYMHDTPSRVY